MLATYGRRELHTTRVEFHVPAPAPWGAAWVEVYKAVSAAIAEMREAGLLGVNQEPSDDRIAIAPGEESVIVSYETRTRVPQAVCRD